MGIISDIIAGDLDAFFDADVFAELVDYTNFAGVVTAQVPAIVGEEHGPIEDTAGGRVDARERDIRVRLDRIPKPVHGETFTYAGDKWVIDNVVMSGQGTALCRCVFKPTIEVAGRGYRNR